MSSVLAVTQSNHTDARLNTVPSIRQWLGSTGMWWGWIWEVRMPPTLWRLQNNYKQTTTTTTALTVSCRILPLIAPRLTVITSLSSLEAFKRALKTELFRRSYAQHRQQYHWHLWNTWHIAALKFLQDLCRDEIRWWWWLWIIDTNVFKRHLKAFPFTESFA